MKEKLSKREKKMLCIGGSMVFVSAGLAAYFGIKYYDINKYGKKTNEEIRLLKFLTIEGGLVPKALQNANNKLQRIQTKLERIYSHVDKYGSDVDTDKLISKLKSDKILLMADISKAEELQLLLDSNDNLYA